MERNVICVKWGNKFSARHVNRLYTMAQKNITVPFSFYCLTEDPTDVKCETIPLDLSLGLEKWWWKICLFKDNIFSGDVNLYFDLDVIIQNNIDNLFNISRFTIIDLSHKENNVSNNSFVNSSILGWRNNSTQWIYDKFMADKDYYLKYYRGLDTFFSYDIEGYDAWDDSVYYSRNLGNYDFCSPNDEKVPIPGGSDSTYYYPEKQVCIFNHTHQDKYYKGYDVYF